MMRVITAYKTDDGTVFEYAAEADRHEADLDRRDRIYAWLAEDQDAVYIDGRVLGIDHLTHWIDQNHIQLRELLL